jgi:hypothetical protein
MAKPRIPLPKQVEKVHRAESQYDRRIGKRVSLDDLETYVMTDQPETCRACGARTQFRHVTDTKQFHQCTDCGESYWLVEEENG